MVPDAAQGLPESITTHTDSDATQELKGDNMFLTVKTITDEIITINVNTVELMEAGKVDNIKGTFIRFIDGTEKFIPIKKITLVNLMLKANEAFYCNPDAEYYEDEDEDEEEEEDGGI